MGTAGCDEGGALIEGASDCRSRDDAMAAAGSAMSLECPGVAVGAMRVAQEDRVVAARTMGQDIRGNQTERVSPSVILPRSTAHSRACRYA